MASIIERIRIKTWKSFWIAVQDLKSIVEKLTHRLKSVGTLEHRVEALEARLPYIAICPAKPEETEQEQKQSKEKDDDDEDIDLFGSDSEASEQR